MLDMLLNLYIIVWCAGVPPGKVSLIYELTEEVPQSTWELLYNRYSFCFSLTNSQMVTSCTKIHQFHTLHMMSFLMSFSFAKEDAHQCDIFWLFFSVFSMLLHSILKVIYFSFQVWGWPSVQSFVHL